MGETKQPGSLPVTFVASAIGSYLDPGVIRDINLFHGQTNFVTGSWFTEGVGLPALPQSVFAVIQDNEVRFTDDRQCDIPLLPSADGDWASENAGDDGPLLRNRSTLSFETVSVARADFAAFLRRSFFRGHGERPYASAGALYPIEVFVAVRSQRLAPPMPSGFYHLLPVTGALEPIRLLDDAQLMACVTGSDAGPPDPGFSVIYVLFLGRATVKYRFKGYRFGLMEVGAMYQQADLVAKSLGLKTRVWGGFCEHRILRWLQLDPCTFLPLVVQHVGP